MGRVLVQQPGTNTTKASTEILPKNVIIVDEDLHQLRLHDGTTPGGHVIGSSGGGNNSNALLSFMWADHQLNDMSWLRADTFSWQSGDVYVAAYNHLVADYENAPRETLYAWTSASEKTVYTKTPTPAGGDEVYDKNCQLFGKIDGDYDETFITVNYYTSSGDEYFRDSAKDTVGAQTETIGNITITYYLSDDGHKICTPGQESNIIALYEATGVAWYYILDTTNKQFKLPRTKWGFTGLRDSVGGYVAPGLPDHNHKIIIDTKWGSKNANNGPNWCGDDATRATNIAATSTNASQSNSIYGASNTVQPPATQMYLYFYVGNFEQSAIEQTAGITSEQLNNKADISLFNAIYPVGSIYIGTQSTCPMEIAIPGSSWELLEAGRALWTGNGSNGNTTIAAGLPNTTGYASFSANGGTDYLLGVVNTGYALYGSTDVSSSHGVGGGNNHSGAKRLQLDASRSSSIYGQSTTVQPPAYVVNVWRRTV